MIGRLVNSPTRDDLFKINAGIVKSLYEAIAKYCPNRPSAEVFKSKGVYDERRLFSVTTLDVIRAKIFHAGKANVNVADEYIKALTKRTQDDETKGWKEFSYTFNVYARASFTDACLKRLDGIPDVIECSVVQSTITELPFLASKVCKDKFVR
ncbi:hypothetical protein OROGR_007323 [Orobanche gracilis]